MGLEDLAHPASPEQLHDFVDAVEKLTGGEDPVVFAEWRLARDNGLSPEIPHISIYIL